MNCEARCEKEVDGCKLFQPLPVGAPSSQGIGARIHYDFLMSERKEPFLIRTGWSLDTDFFMKLGMKLGLHLVEIGIFSLNNVTFRIINNFHEHLKILIFKVIF